MSSTGRELWRDMEGSLEGEEEKLSEHHRSKAIHYIYRESKHAKKCTEAHLLRGFGFFYDSDSAELDKIGF